MFDHHVFWFNGSLPRRSTGCLHRCHITEAKTARWLLPYHQRNSSRAAIVSKFQELCINTGHHSSFIHHQRNFLGTVYQTRFSFSRQKKLRSRPLLRTGQSPVNKSTKGPRPQGGQIHSQAYRDCRYRKSYTPSVLAPMLCRVKCSVARCLVRHSVALKWRIARKNLLASTGHLCQANENKI